MQIAPSATSYVSPPAAGCTQYCNWSSTGASWESAIDIANTTHTDMWINIPVMATDDYVKSLAALIKSQLNPNLRVYVEWSDEIWNWGNPYWTETSFVTNQVKALIDGSNPAETAAYAANCASWAHLTCRVAERVMQFGQDFASVYGQAAINTTIRPVLCTQVVQPAFLMTALKFIALTYGPPSNYFYGTCGAPYWSPANPVPAGTTAAGAVAAYDAAIPANDGYLQTDTAIALFYGLHNLTYEGGPDYTGLAVAGDTTGTATAALTVALQIAPGLRNDVIQGLTRAYADGVDMYVFYQNLNSTYYGATTDPLDLQAPKFQGLQAVAGQLITRTAGTTLPGTVLVGPTTFGISGGTLVRAGSDVLGTNCQLSLSPPVCSFNTSIAKGDGIAFLVNVPKAGNYAISINMDTTQTIFAGSVQLTLDQKPVQTFSFPRTSAGATLTLGPATVSLSAGLHLIAVLNEANGNYAIDGITATAN